MARLEALIVADMGASCSAILEDGSTVTWNRVRTREVSKVEEICKVMTLEEAGAIVVPRGPCMGWTMAQVAEQRPSSLRFYLSGFASQCGNIQLAAATLLMQDIEMKKAG